LALPNAADRVWAAALTLILLVLVLNILARLIARFSTIKTK
jgi:phosphate transport system permease protein